MAIGKCESHAMYQLGILLSIYREKLWGYEKVLYYGYFLKQKGNERHQFALLKMKYLASKEPKDAINGIKTDALVTTRIPGLLQFIPRFNTLEKVGEY